LCMWSRMTRCTFRHTPAADHFWCQRCAVAGGTPNVVDASARQAHPVCSTNTIASTTARGSVGGRPPLGVVRGRATSGAINCQSVSGRCNETLVLTRQYQAANPASN
jgi:hypothetical protein